MKLITHKKDWEAFKKQVEKDNDGRTQDICTAEGLERQYKAGSGEERMVFFMRAEKKTKGRVELEVCKQLVQYPLSESRF